jgi:enamine deaminase RidA (YjgF/YER057c/UK114 family)
MPGVRIRRLSAARRAGIVRLAMDVEWRMAERGRMAWVSGMAPDPASDAREQSARILERIGELLEASGYARSRILTASVSLDGMNLLEVHEAAWQPWIEPHARPLRTCRAEKLGRPGSLVRIEVTAVR